MHLKSETININPAVASYLQEPSSTSLDLIYWNICSMPQFLKSARIASSRKEKNKNKKRLFSNSESQPEHTTEVRTWFLHVRRVAPTEKKKGHESEISMKSQKRSLFNFLFQANIAKTLSWHW